MRLSDQTGRQNRVFDNVARLIAATPRTWSFSISIALALVALATLLRAALHAVVGERLVFAFYYPAVTLAAVLGGFRGAAIALVASVLAGALLFAQPPNAIEPMSTPDTAALITFLISAGLEGLIAGTLRCSVLQLRERDSQLSLIAAELRHRVKNMLAVVMSASRQIGRTSPDQAAFQVAFEARLKALARAHDILARSGWAGADLRGLIGAHLAPFVSVDGPRLLLQGDDLTLAPDTAVALSLTLHELTTNAVKYGALSTPTGLVTLSWRCDRLSDQLVVDWLERGGPKVEPPRRKGFGTTLIDRSLAPGHSIDFDPAGLHVVACFPFRCRSPTPQMCTPDERQPPGARR